jgi:cell division protein FtsN
MKSPARGGFALGLIIGLLLGLGLALGVALYITKVPIPFVDKLPQRTAEQDAAEAERNRNWDPNAPLAGKNPARPASVPAPSASGTADAASAPPVRPGTAASAVRTSPLAVTPAASATATAASAARPVRDPAAILAGQSPKSTGSAADAFSYYVQAGAYSRPEDAETQRARLAMLGLDAKVMEREQSGRTVYRVRLGPYDGRPDAEAVQVRLAGDSIEANLVRVER